MPFPSRILVCSDIPSCGVLVVANFVYGGNLMYCGVMWYDVMWLFRGDVRTGNVVCCEMSCYVMLRDVMSNDVL